MSELPVTPSEGVRLAGEPPVSPDVLAPPRAVIAEGVMPLVSAPVEAPAPVISPPEPEAERPMLPIESLLLRFRMITPAQLAEAMKEQAVTGKSVATIVVEQGWVTPEDMAQITPNAPPALAEPAAADAAEPVVEPVAAPVEPVAQAPVVAQPVVVPVAEPTPVAAPEPVAAEPEPLVAAPPVLIAPEPVVEVEFAPMAAAPEPLEALVAVEPETEPAWQFQVLAHLVNGERVEIARVASADEAKAAAHEAMRSLRDGADWPLLSGRYVRPESILSIDVAALL